MVIKVSVPDRFQFKMVPTFKNMMMLKQGDVHYIGGSDVLPAPLEQKKKQGQLRDWERGMTSLQSHS